MYKISYKCFMKIGLDVGMVKISCLRGERDGGIVLVVQKVIKIRKADACTSLLSESMSERTESELRPLSLLSPLLRFPAKKVRERKKEEEEELKRGRSERGKVRGGTNVDFSRDSPLLGKGRRRGFSLQKRV